MIQKPDIAIIGLDDKRKNQLLTHWRATPDQHAVFAMDLVKLMSVTSGAEKAKTMLTPQQIVDRAITIAETMFAAFEAKDWIIKFPSYEEMESHRSDAPPAMPGFK